MQTTVYCWPCLFENIYLWLWSLFQKNVIWAQTVIWIQIFIFICSRYIYKSVKCLSCLDIFILNFTSLYSPTKVKVGTIWLLPAVLFLYLTGQKWCPLFPLCRRVSSFVFHQNTLHLVFQWEHTSPWFLLFMNLNFSGF